MVFRNWKMWVLLTLLLIIYLVAGTEHCEITNLKKVDNICTARIDCQYGLDFDVKNWDCIKHKSTEPVYRTDYYGNRRYSGTEREITTYDEEYYLIINVKQPQQVNSLLFDEKHFIKLSLEGGGNGEELLTIPDDVYKMKKLEELTISCINIGTVNLHKFLSMSLLREILLKNNTIRFIEADEEVEPTFGRQLSNVKHIDLSINLIEALPNNFVSRFIQLQHLNLSNNKINSIGLLTFEGIVQLQILDLSNNRLFEIGYALARFGNLKEFSVSNNNLTELNKYNLATLSNLEKMNASFNSITDIENNTFRSLTNLKNLDLRHNKLKTISNYFFNTNNHLKELMLSDNEIQSIEENSFSETQLTEFGIQNNPLVGVLKQNTFRGVNVSFLSLSGGNLTSIEDMAFANMVHLNNLNLTFNSITNISSLAFSSLLSLSILDLSHNLLKELKIDSRNLQNLTKLYAHHNNIEKIILDVFENFVSLKELDLSYNAITQIEHNSFMKLNNLVRFSVKGSQFVNILESRIFDGLISLQNLDMSQTKTTIFQNESFSGLNALTDLNCSFGLLSQIEYNAFLRTGLLERLTLSNNRLQHFHINTSNIPQIKELYLNNNFIENISTNAFSNMTSLRVLQMKYNKLIELNTDTFQNLYSLTYLDLSYNEKMTVIGNPFQNLTKLYSLSLEKVRKEISFENSSASVELLNLQSCGITNVNKMYIYNVQGLSYLNLGMNKITTIDKDSFKNMTALVILDLSLNKITFIQPGSFLHIKKLTQLNLYGNDLATIQFGVFDGIEFLNKLNISRNVLTKFDVRVLPNISKIYLDDNIINYLNFEDFFDINLLELSVGGNQISCKVLAELKVSKYSEKFKEIVKTNKIDFHSENVNGISCQTAANVIRTADHVSDNPSINISPILSALRYVLEKLSHTLEVISDNTNSTDELKNHEDIVLSSLKNVIESTNKSQNSNSIYLSRLTEINNASYLQLGEIKKYLKELADNKKVVDTSIQTTNSPKDEQFLRFEFQNMLKKENDALREEFRAALASISKGTPIQESLISSKRDWIDSKTVIYFMAACMAIMLTVFIGNIIFKHIVTSRRSYGRHSRSAISNSIEMG